MRWEKDEVDAFLAKIDRIQDREMEQIINAVQVGLRPIGRNIVELGGKKRGIEVVGVVDLDHVGRELSEAANIGQPSGLLVSSDLRATLEGTKTDIIFKTTSSALDDIFPQLKTILDFGVEVVSTSEELAFHYSHQPDLA